MLPQDRINIKFNRPSLWTVYLGSYFRIW